MNYLQRTYHNMTMFQWVSIIMIILSFFFALKPTSAHAGWGHSGGGSSSHSSRSGDGSGGSHGGLPRMSASAMSIIFSKYPMISSSHPSYHDDVRPEKPKVQKIIITKRLGGIPPLIYFQPN